MKTGIAWRRRGFGISNGGNICENRISGVAAAHARAQAAAVAAVVNKDIGESKRSGDEEMSMAGGVSSAVKIGSASGGKWSTAAKRRQRWRLVTQTRIGGNERRGGVARLALRYRLVG